MSSEPGPSYPYATLVHHPEHPDSNRAGRVPWPFSAQCVLRPRHTCACQDLGQALQNPVELVPGVEEGVSHWGSHIFAFTYYPGLAELLVPTRPGHLPERRQACRSSSWPGGWHIERSLYIISPHLPFRGPTSQAFPLPMLNPVLVTGSTRGAG